MPAAPAPGVPRLSTTARPHLQVECLNRAEAPSLPTLTPPPPHPPPIKQAFNWESCKQPWYNVLAGQAKAMKEDGFTAVWLPPPSDAVSDQVRFKAHALLGAVVVASGKPWVSWRADHVTTPAATSGSPPDSTVSLIIPLN